jgi:AAA domain-containing protein
MSGFPVRYAHGNILVGPDGQAAGLYRLSMSSYRFLPVQGKRLLQRRLERFASTIGADFSLWRVSRGYPADRYATGASRLLDDRHAAPERWLTFLEGHVRRLQELQSHLPEVYVAVSLDSQRRPSGLGAGLIRFSDRTAEQIRTLVHVGGRSPIAAQHLSELAGGEQRVFERLTGLLGVRRARTVELQWLIARAGTRGLGEPRLDEHWRPQALRIENTDGTAAYEPLEQILWRCANAPVTERERCLVVEGERGESHQALLALGALPDAPLFPGAAAELLFAPLESTSFPVDAVLHARWVGNRDALAQVRKRIADVENAYSEQLQGSAHGPGILAGQDRMLAREYEAQLQSGARPAMLYATIGLAVGAPEAEELQRRVGALQERYGDVLLHRPAGLQYRLWLDHLPRPDGGRVTDYTQQVTVEQFGAMVPVATHAVGSKGGVYLGYTPTGVRRPVRYDATAPSRESRASAVLLAGTLGSGKTVAAQLIAHAAALRGSRIIDIDPKPDHGWHDTPDLAGEVEILELSGDDSQQGKLDPLSIGLSEIREELACSYLLELLRDPPAAWENAIGRAVRDTVREGARSTITVVERLKNEGDGQGREAGEALEVLCDLGLARLGFATANSPGNGRESVADGPRVLSIRTPGLSLPDPSVARETYTRSERISTATLTLLAAYVLRLISTNRETHKVVLLDEASSFLASRQGHAVMERLIRMGRACNTTVLLATQLVSDLGGLVDLIGTWLIFGQESDREARRALSLLGLDPADDVLASLLCEFRKGRCLMRDLDGRVGEVQIDPADPRLLAAFDTTPDQSAGRSEA